jgi:membrane-associated phospholipid phosphatase
MPDVLQWPLASALFFAYAAAAAALLPRLPSGRRRRAASLAIPGFLLSLAAPSLVHRAILHDWLLPPALLLLAYWSSGALFVAPMPRAETALMRLDRRLGVRQAAGMLPRAAAELLELAYLGVYPLIPAALVLHVLLTPQPDPAHFWTVILITDYICFATLPWVQTRPPRALEAADPWQSSVRSFNRRLHQAASIRVNTFPSGHAAEALAAALLVSGAPAPVFAAMLIAALCISAGAVLGRYHYALDALTGWAVGLGVWLFYR